MIDVIAQAAAPIGLRARHAGEVDFRLVASDRQQVVEGETEIETTIDDAVFRSYEAADFENLQDVVVYVPTPATLRGGFTFQSLDPHVATIDAAGTVSWVSDGSARILVTSQATGLIRRCIVVVSRVLNDEVTEFDRWADGSVAKAVSDAVDGAIATGDPASLMPMYSNLAARVRNPACWAAQLADLSCIDAEKPGAVLIAPQYAIQAEHYPDGGDVFVDMAGNVFSRSVVASRNIGPPNSQDGYVSDIRVVKYDSPLPASIVPALLPPSNLRSHFGAPGNKVDANTVNGVAMLVTDQEKKAIVGDLWTFDGVIPSHPYVIVNLSADSRRAMFNEGLVSGDSGSTEFFFQPGSWGSYSHRLMALTAGLTGGLINAGPPYHLYLAEIIAAIEDMGGSAEDVEIADLSSWPTY